MIWDLHARGLLYKPLQELRFHIYCMGSVIIKRARFLSLFLEHSELNSELFKRGHIGHKEETPVEVPGDCVSAGGVLVPAPRIGRAQEVLVLCACAAIGNSVLSLRVLCASRLMLRFKGSLTRDFRLQVFFINQCPSGPWVFHKYHFDFFRKIAEIFAN